MNLQTAVSVSDVRELARRRLPNMIFNFVEGGAEDEYTFRANQAALDRWEFQPSVLNDVSKRTINSSIAGFEVAAPLVLSPAGLTRAVHPDGEYAVAQAAAAHNIPYVLQPFATFTIEELAALGGPLWFEVGGPADPELRSSLIKRAKAAEYQVLLYMVDTPVGGRRERELRQGIGFPPRYSLRNIVDGCRHPRWGIGWWKSAHNVAPRNIEGAGGHRSLLPKVPSMAPFGPRISSAAGTWEDFRRVRDEWDGPFGAKGIITVADAVKAVENGANIIVVSNHGGRQLDGLPGTVDALPDIVDAVAGRAQVLVDGGIRRGTHIAKCVSLGATACLVGRPYHYGLGAGGREGVDRVITMLKAELDLTVALLGCTSVSQLDRSRVKRADHRVMPFGEEKP